MTTRQKVLCGISALFGGAVLVINMFQQASELEESRQRTRQSHEEVIRAADRLLEELNRLEKEFDRTQKSYDQMLRGYDQRIEPQEEFDERLNIVVESRQVDPPAP